MKQRLADYVADFFLRRTALRMCSAWWAAAPCI